MLYLFMTDERKNKYKGRACFLDHFINYYSTWNVNMR